MSMVKEIIAALRIMQLVASLDVVASSFFLWEYLLTFNDELKYFWEKKSISMIQFLFIIQRYLPFVDTVIFILYHQFGGDLSEETCTMLYNFSAYSIVIGMGFGEMIFGIRTWAVYNRDRRVGGALVIIFLMCWVPMFVIMNSFLRSTKFHQAPYPDFKGCLVVSANNSMIYAWVLLMAWDTIVLVFVLVPGYREYRAGGTSLLLKVICRDGIIYYIYLCVLSSINIAVVSALPDPYQHLLTSIERSFHSVITSRFLFNIRATLEEDLDISLVVDTGLARISNAQPASDEQGEMQMQTRLPDIEHHGCLEEVIDHNQGPSRRRKTMSEG